MAGHRRRTILTVVALAVGVSGCAIGGLLPSKGPDSDKLHQQAHAALARWTEAVAAAGGRQGFVLVGETNGQVGDWEVQVGDNNKIALMEGLIQATVDLSAEAPPDGELGWPDGTTETVRVISAQQALSEMRSAGTGGCPDCKPLKITAAKHTSGQVQTGRGPAMAPVWEFTLQGTTVRVTHVAIAGRINVVPPPWNSNDPPAGLSIASASGTVGGQQLTVMFTGAPAPGDQRCGADYSAEAVESATAVVVIITVHPHASGESCSLVGAERTAVAELAAPLGERAVLEVMEGLPVRVLLTR